MKKPHKSPCLLRITLLSLAFVEPVLPCMQLAYTRHRKKQPRVALLSATPRGSAGRFPAGESLSRRGIPGCTTPRNHPCV
jgi:hypothetical protein